MPGPQLPSLNQPPPVTESDVQVVRERFRGWVAVGLIAALVFVILVMTVTGTQQIKSMSDIEQFVGAILTPLVGLVGTVVGFYFGEKAASGS
jgi:hypothetical protein